MIRKNKRENRRLPELYQSCGTEDYLYKENVDFHQFLLDEGVPVNYYEAAGEHNFNFWEPGIKKIVEWL
ncbi:putative acetylesterase [Listeria floridensis FSL S10-1187]|uniref:Acetylesterase n=1 Tax=Listeria floridensis FSL S10-1187 TaxID=1265817 RepID=A0ABN0RER9_9LIST|nr:hypothetical protein [Listeria floridensis]EUJ31352.1 putative acetylesterase [Listeria floridensis FSL S10-1187]